jgi:plasmid maintenance system antidote protein VapI
MLKSEPIALHHPSVFIKEECEARGWSLDMLAMRMGPDFGHHRLALDMSLEIGPSHANMVVGERSAKALGRAFGIDPQFFLNLCKQWREAAIASSKSKGENAT